MANKNLSNDDLKKHLASQIALEDWTDECGKCGYPKLLCAQEREFPNILRENWREYNTRMKPILKTMKEDFKKEVEQGVLLQGLTDLINSNTESISKLINSNTLALTSVLATKKTEASLSPSNDSSSPPSRTAKLTKPAKVSSWTKDMSLETYIKQLTT